jgi:DNA-binding GntR family transcriptional regulator
MFIPVPQNRDEPAFNVRVDDPINEEEDAGEVSARDRVVAFIKEKIQTGEWAPKRRIPSQGELASELAAPHRQVVFAIADLREQGYLVTFSYKGSYVCPSEDRRRET